MKLGKLPARKDAVQFKLSTFTDLSKLPTPPASHGHQDELVSWGMLANDQVGDCVLAGADHETMLWNKLAGRTVQFTDTTALRDYSAITGYNPDDPSTDQGTDMQVAASYRRKTGVVDVHGTRHKVAAYLG